VRLGSGGRVGVRKALEATERQVGGGGPARGLYIIIILLYIIFPIWLSVEVLVLILIIHNTRL
jgi:hypothetical protein